jgi:glutamate synthase domain-containing protein 3
MERGRSFEKDRYFEELMELIPRISKTTKKTSQKALDQVLKNYAKEMSNNKKLAENRKKPRNKSLKLMRQNSSAIFQSGRSTEIAAVMAPEMS